MSEAKFPMSLVMKLADQFSAPLSKLTSKLEGVGKLSAKVGGTMSLGLTAPLAAIGAASFMAFAQFEAGMANVSTLIDTNVESMAALEKGIFEVTRAVKVKPLAEMTDALASIRGAGILAADQFVVLEGSGKLAAAALGTTAEAADIATSAINAWGLKGEAARGVYNNVFQAVNTGKMTLSQLAQGFGGVAGTVASAGVQLDEYLASVAALTTTGLPAAEAHTQLKSVIAGLTGSTKEATAVFQRLKVKGIKELIATSGGLVPALEKIRGVVKTNDTVLLKALGGAEAFNAVIGLTGNQAPAFRTALDTMRSGVDGLSVAFDKQSKTSAASLQGMRNDVEIAAISIGSALAPAVKDMVPHVQGATAAWTSMGVEGQKSLIMISVGLAALGPGITVLGNLLTVMRGLRVAFSWVAGWTSYLWMMRASIIAGLIPSLKAATLSMWTFTSSFVAAPFVWVIGWIKYIWMMRASILAGLVPSMLAAASSVWAFTAALLANPITWVVLAVVALAGAAYLIYRNWEPISKFFSGLWDGIKAAFTVAMDWLGNKLLEWGVVDALLAVWNPVAPFFTKLWDGIKKAFSAAWDVIKPIVDFMLGPDSTLTMNASVTPTGAPAVPTPLLAAQALPKAGAAGEARVQVDFNNLPPGARVTPAKGNTADLDLNWGFSMETP